VLIILATIQLITIPAGAISLEGLPIYLLGISVDGDHPTSATISSDQENLCKCSTMLAYIFVDQGWCPFVCSLVMTVVLAYYKNVMEVAERQKFDGRKYDFLKTALREANWSIISS